MPDLSEHIRTAIASLDLDPVREAEVVEELNQHLRDRYEEMLIRGFAPDDAYQSLLKEVQDGSLVSELKAILHPVHRPAPVGSDRGERVLAGIWHDLRHGARLLRMNPGFAIVAMLSLALGIGANATIFQLLDAVRLRTLPVKAPEQLVKVHVDSPHCCRGDFYSNNADLTGGIWNRLREQQQGFSGIAAWSPFHFNLGQGGEAHYADTLMVSGEFFNVLGVQPTLGRLISPADDYRGCGARGAVLSYAFWQREFGGRPQVLGSTLTLSGHPFQIMGVAPASFYGIEVGRNFDVAIALCSQPIFSSKTPLMDRPSSWWLAAIGRLRPGWTLERASAQLSAISPGIFAATLPDEFDAPARKDYLSFRLAPLPMATGVSELRHDYEDPLWLLLALSGLVLLIACANLANLMLARASVREREMALRLTLGASRTRLIRQLLAESLLLAVLGTLARAVMSQILSSVLVAVFSNQQEGIFLELASWRPLPPAAILTCILFGLAPAFRPRVRNRCSVKASGLGAHQERTLSCAGYLWYRRLHARKLLVGAFLSWNVP
jgi:predicted permease